MQRETIKCAAAVAAEARVSAMAETLQREAERRGVEAAKAMEAKAGAETERHKLELRVHEADAGEKNLRQKLKHAQSELVVVSRPLRPHAVAFRHRSI